MAKNSFFQFKQFRVNQDKCAMKVCTDACVLGAWASVDGAKRILDIGSGTGLLSLMVAQRNRLAKIDAVEVDENAYLQAVENVNESPYASQIEVFNTSVQDFTPFEKYDCIITNPPFFQADLLSPDQSINKAHHAVTLSFDELLHSFDRLLTENGSCHVLLPVDEALIFMRKARYLGWKIGRTLVLYHNNLKKPFRQLMTFSRNDPSENQTIADELYIYEKDGKTYSQTFQALMKDYYLIF